MTRRYLLGLDFRWRDTISTPLPKGVLKYLGGTHWYIIPTRWFDECRKEVTNKVPMWLQPILSLRKISFTAFLTAASLSLSLRSIFMRVKRLAIDLLQ